MTAQSQLDIDHRQGVEIDDLLQARINELIDHCEQLTDEVIRLRAQRSHLINQNEQARLRVEAMLDKLRAIQLSNLDEASQDA